MAPTLERRVGEETGVLGDLEKSLLLGCLGLSLVSRVTGDHSLPDLGDRV